MHDLHLGKCLGPGRNTCACRGPVSGQAAADIVIDLWQRPDMKQALQHEVHMYNQMTCSMRCHLMWSMCTTGCKPCFMLRCCHRFIMLTAAAHCSHTNTCVAPWTQVLPECKSCMLYTPSFFVPFLFGVQLCLVFAETRIKRVRPLLSRK